MINKMTLFFLENWSVLSFVLFLVINMLNAATRHFSEHKGLVKWLLFIAEELSIIRSAGSPAGSTLGNLKMPLKSVPKDKTAPLALLVLLPFLVSCGITISGVCEKSVRALGLVDAVALPAINAKCLEAAKVCKENGVSQQDCDEWKKCDALRIQYTKAAGVASKSLVKLNEVAHKLEIEKEKVSK